MVSTLCGAPQRDEDALRVFPTLTYRTNFGFNSVRRESPPYLHLHHVFLNRAHQPKGGERSTCCCTSGIYLCSNYPGNVVLIVPLVGQYDRCNGSGQCRERQLRCAIELHGLLKLVQELCATSSLRTHHISRIYKSKDTHS